MYDYKSEREVMTCVLDILKDISDDIKSRNAYFLTETEKTYGCLQKSV